MTDTLHAKLDALLAQCDAARPFSRMPAGAAGGRGGKYAGEEAVREARWNRELKKAEEADKRRAAATARPAPTSRPAASKPTPKQAAPKPAATQPAKPFHPSAPPTGHGIMGPNIPLTNAQRGATTTPSVWDKLKQRVGIKTERPSENAPATGKDVWRILNEEHGGKVPQATNAAFRELDRKNPKLWATIHAQMEANRNRPSAPVRALQRVGKAVGNLIEGLKPLKIGGETRRQFERRLASTPRSENPNKRALEIAEAHKSGRVHAQYGGERPYEHLLNLMHGDSARADAAPAPKLLTHQK